MQNASEAAWGEVNQAPKEMGGDKRRRRRVTFVHSEESRNVLFLQVLAAPIRR